MPQLVGLMAAAAIIFACLVALIVMLLRLIKWLSAEESQHVQTAPKEPELPCEYTGGEHVEGESGHCIMCGKTLVQSVLRE